MENNEQHIKPGEEKSWYNNPLPFERNQHPGKKNDSGTAQEGEDVREDLTATYWG